MGRTNIEIDDELIARVMERYGFRSKREAVERGLRSLDVEPLSREEILALEGMGWEGDLDAMRSDAPVVRSSDRPGMSLIDSSAWIEFFRATGSQTHRRVREHVSSGSELVTTEPVLMELLAGAPGPGDRRRIKGTLAACRMASVDNAGDWEEAAGIYLRCRARGVTPRRLLDCLIAAVAVRVGVPILAQDADFELIAEHTPLELAT